MLEVKIGSQRKAFILAFDMKCEYRFDDGERLKAAVGAY